MSVALHHRIEGPADAPPVLFASSLGTSLGMWEAQTPLADGLQMILFDHRGHGHSPVPDPPYTVAEMGEDTLALMDHLGLQRASFVGLSLGGIVGQWLAAHAPDRVDRLVLICTTAHFPNGAVYSERAETVAAAGSTAPVAGVVEERWLTPATVAARPELADRLRAEVLATPGAGYVGGCHAVAGADLRDSLSAISAPTLVISGAEDQATPVAMQAELAAGIPGARHEIVQGAAHMAAAERPSEVNALLTAHLLPT